MITHVQFDNKSEPVTMSGSLKDTKAFIRKIGKKSKRMFIHFVRNNSDDVTSELIGFAIVCQTK